MKTKNQLYHAANADLERRRRDAEAEQQRRVELLSVKLPQIEQCRRVLLSTGVALSRAILSGGGEAAVEKIRRENLEAQDIIKRLLAENGYPEQYLDILYHCAACKDTGRTKAGKICECLQTLRCRQMLDYLRESHPLDGYDFSDFSLKFYSNEIDRETGILPSKHMERILAYCHEYANTFSKESDSLLLLGKTGLGKTHLSLSIAKTVASAGYLVEYGTAPDLLRQLEREHFSRDTLDDASFDAMLEADLLILDDLGSEFSSSFTSSAVYQLLNTRLAKSKPTIISTNLDWRTLEERYTRRVISRISSEYVTLKFIGQDVRQQKRMAK